MNSRDSFPRWKLKNRSPTSCSPGPILWPPTISFELQTEMAEEIDLEKCTFRNFGSSVTLTLTLDWVEVTLVRICDRGLPTHQIRWKLEKLFVDVQTDGRTHLSSNLLGHLRGDDLKNETTPLSFPQKLSTEEQSKAFTTKLVKQTLQSVTMFVCYVILLICLKSLEIRQLTD